ncbi:hypothetical protein HanHA300_Chr08g0290601 [Helianthus annuus]|nr:hypothetical protein HanHA300_Chr08g0290601 [Helianthus annuus]
MLKRLLLKVPIKLICSSSYFVFQRSYLIHAIIFIYFIIRLVMNKRPATLLITNGYRPVVGYGGDKVNSFGGSLVYDIRHDESKEDSGEYGENLFSDDEDGGGYRGRGGGGGYWSGRSVEEIKWDAMFQNLKPT